MVQDFSGKRRNHGSNKGFSGRTPSSYSPADKSTKRAGKRTRRSSFGHGIRLIALFFILILGGIGLSLLQAGMSSQKAFWSRLELIVNFANPTKRFVYIYPGMRREEIVEKYADVLNWTDKDKRWFIASAPADPANGGFEEGYFLPKAYVVDKDATGKEVGALMHQEFMDAVDEKVLTSQGSAIAASVDTIIGDANAVLKSADSDAKDGNDSSDLPNAAADATKPLAGKTPKSPEDLDLDTAVRIASIIQREAAGPQDMRLISGIIWNRIAKGMSLELDATLQYVKGNEDNWWPAVKSKDKYLDSPYNTYKYKGVPPGAISNPSIDAIKAVYNPQKTDCIFYLHDSNRRIHCSKSYQQHLENIRAYL